MVRLYTGMSTAQRAQAQPDRLFHIQVLIVDGSEISRTVLRSFLEAEGYVTLEAQAGIDAVPIVCVAQERLVVLVDAYLPDMDGEDFLRLILHDTHLLTHHDYVFVADGATPPSAATQRFLAHNGVAILSSPYTREALVATVVEATTRRQRARKSVVPASN